MKYVYGPVPSRRLGSSLGIDPIPLKTCNYQCVYCQLGKTTCFTNMRKNYAPKFEILREIEIALKISENIVDYITFVGSGEPTLYKDLKDLIIKLKELSNKPVCIITNGGLLNNNQVQEALMLADVVLPSLDGGDKETFLKINRPHPAIKFDEVIQGFIDFKKFFNGKFWIEIMLVKGINDSKDQLLKIKNIIDKIEPDRIDINVPIRPPAEKWVKIPDEKIISVLDEILGDYNNINFPEIGNFAYYSSNFEKEFLSLIQRHPMRQEQIIETFTSEGLDGDAILSKLQTLAHQQKIERIDYLNSTYWELKR
ncbi:MAG: radical SAM protein [Candidatus Lokiarchaeota archaeon]|nr:radical SAM protein [Candidatus Lokiarchaeota archaeon]